MKNFSNLVIYLVFLISIKAIALDRASFNRYSKEHSSYQLVTASKISTKIDKWLTVTEAWAFEDIIPEYKLNHNREFLNETENNELKFIENLVLNFDKIIFPKFIEFLYPEKFKRFQNYSIPFEPSLTLLFDKFHENDKFRAYVNKAGLGDESKNLIVFDIASIFSNSRYFSLMSVHELQHIFNNYYDGNEEDWLNEGLSRFLECHLNKITPRKQLEKYFLRHKTPALFKWPSEKDEILSSALGDYYTNAFLFLSYLYFHFGEDELIRALIFDEENGVMSVETNIKKFASQNIDGKFLEFKSIYLNYSLALLLNTRSYAKHALFSLNGNTKVNTLRNYQIKPEILYFSPTIDGSFHKELKLGPFQSSYHYLFNGNYCIEYLEKDENVKFYLVDYSNDKIRVENVTNNLCFSFPASLKKLPVLMLVNFSEQNKAQELSINLNLIKK